MVWVPLPVCHTTNGKCSSSEPDITSSEASWIAFNDLVDVPDFQGIFLSEALKIIEERGFFEGKIQYVENKEFLPNTVLNQSPKEGTKVSQGSKINLVIAK